MSLPLFKLGALFVKQLSKPLGKAIKEKATSNEKIRNYVVIPTAKVYHRLDINLRMRILGLGAPDEVPALTDAKAIEIGGDLLAEFIVFGTGIAIVLVEYWRSVSKAAHKEESDDKKLARLDEEQKKLIKNLEDSSNTINDLKQLIKDQTNKTDELTKKYDKLVEKSKIKAVAKGNQTTQGRQVGKIITPSKSFKSADSDVRNSILFQVAEEAVNEMRFYGVK